MRKIVLAATLISVSPLAADAAETTCKVVGPRKYCESTVRNMKATIVMDAAGKDAYSLTVNARRDTSDNTTDALAYIGTMMTVLEPNSSQNQRAASMTKMIEEANQRGNGRARFGAFNLALRFNGPNLMFFADRAAASR